VWDLHIKAIFNLQHTPWSYVHGALVRVGHALAFVKKKNSVCGGKPPPNINIRRRVLTQVEKISEPLPHPYTGVS